MVTPRPNDSINDQHILRAEVEVPGKYRGESCVRKTVLAMMPPMPPNETVKAVWTELIERYRRTKSI